MNSQYQSKGSVEGVLRFNLSFSSAISIDDILTEKRVEFIFTKLLSQYPIGLKTFGKRVEVFGIVTYNEAGEKLKIEAERIKVFPPEETLPTIEDVTGILS